MHIAVNGWAANVHANRRGILWLKGFLFPAEGIIDIQWWRLHVAKIESSKYEEKRKVRSTKYEEKGKVRSTKYEEFLTTDDRPQSTVSFTWRISPVLAPGC
jgi:hypothetical protein